MSAPTHPAARYPLHVRWSDEDDAYIGSIPGLAGDCCHADTPEDVLSQLKGIAEDLVDYLRAEGKALPPACQLSSDPDPAMTRKAMGLSQADFARFLDVSVRTLHKWEQHAARPSGAARTLLKLAASNPQAVRQALQTA
ncbi:MAG: helix-turn-helix domain-containing protein [Verrucomicrobiota bacterium]